MRSDLQLIAGALAQEARRLRSLADGKKCAGPFYAEVRKTLRNESARTLNLAAHFERRAERESITQKVSNLAPSTTHPKGQHNGATP